MLKMAHNSIFLNWIKFFPPLWKIVENLFTKNTTQKDETSYSAKNQKDKIDFKETLYLFKTYLQKLRGKENRKKMNTRDSRKSSGC